MTRILHLSDVHCRSDKLEKALEQLDYDLVTVSGDFECVDTARLFIEKARSPAVAVTGNLDNPGVSRLLREKNILIDGRVVEVSGLLIAGVGGMEVVGNLRMIKSRAPSRGVDILLTHHPPRGVLDKTFIGVNAGLEELWDLIKLLSPRFHLFGHIHESAGVIVSEDGVVFVNPGPLARGNCALIDVDTGQVEMCNINI
ncbi:MAG: metallophosphoesterase family protein [Desulfurococcales archaeon]|nr:metallophosphoesterase family protein [Desulfurococcales archaeon]